MNIDESMITSEPKYPLAVRCSFISLNEDGELKEAEDSLGIVLENLDSFTINRALTMEEVEILTKNGFLVTSTICYYDNSASYPPIRKAVVETHVERIRNRTY